MSFAFLQYDKWQDQTTVGMPEFKTVAPVEKKEETTPSKIEEEALSEDVYTFIAVGAYFSPSFLYALAVILLKYLVYSILVFGVYKKKSDLDFYKYNKVQAVKFLLIPVAIAMQEDLIHVYAYAANLKYDKKVLKDFPHATKFKLVLSLLLRLIDGLFSLAVNFLVMLTTHDSVVQVFLNFAALHFLQSIDDVFFVLLTKGFFGEEMEKMSDKCKHVTFPRRQENGFTKNFDSVLFFLTLIGMIVAYSFVTHIAEKRAA